MRTILILLVCFATACPAADRQVILRLINNPEREPDTVFDQVSLEVAEPTPDGPKTLPGWDIARSKGATDSDCFKMFRRAKGQPKAERHPIAISIKRAKPPGIVLQLPAPVDRKRFDYFVVVGKGCLQTRPGFDPTPFADREIGIDAPSAAIDERILKAVPDTSLKLLQGEKTGAVSLHAFYKRYFDPSQNTPDLAQRDGVAQQHSFRWDKDALFQARLDADISFRPKETGQYLNRIEGEAGGYLTGDWRGSLVEIGFSSKLQADQQFDVVDQTVGLNGWLWWNAEFWDQLNDLMFIGPKDKERQSFWPLFVLGYDFVGHWKNDREGDRNENEGHHRIFGRFYWNVPIIRDTSLAFTGKKLDLDFITDISAIYQIEKGEFAPEVKLALDLSFSSEEKHSSFTFTYVNGKTAPRFENFDALLAGFKYIF